MIVFEIFFVMFKLIFLNIMEGKREYDDWYKNYINIMCLQLAYSILNTPSKHFLFILTFPHE